MYVSCSLLELADVKKHRISAFWFSPSLTGTHTLTSALALAHAHIILLCSLFPFFLWPHFVSFLGFEDVVSASTSTGQKHKSVYCCLFPSSSTFSRIRCYQYHICVQQKCMKVHLYYPILFLILLVLLNTQVCFDTVWLK